MEKYIYFDRPDTDADEARRAVVMYNDSTYLADNPNNCWVDYSITHSYETYQSNSVSTVSVTSACGTSSYTIPNCKDAPIAWAFAVQAMQAANVTPSRIKRYFEELENGATLAPLELVPDADGWVK